MPLGEVAWKNSPGPQHGVKARLPLETYAVFKLAAIALETTPSTLLTEIAQEWADAWVEEHRDWIADAVAAEKERRET